MHRAERKKKHLYSRLVYLKVILNFEYHDLTVSDILKLTAMFELGKATYDNSNYIDRSFENC